MTDEYIFGNLLACYRKRLGLHQKELAELLHIKRIQTISDWERGFEIPNANHLLDLTEALKLDDKEKETFYLSARKGPNPQDKIDIKNFITQVNKKTEYFQLPIGKHVKVMKGFIHSRVNKSIPHSGYVLSTVGKNSKYKTIYVESFLYMNQIHAVVISPTRYGKTTLRNFLIQKVIHGDFGDLIPIPMDMGLLKNSYDPVELLQKSIRDLFTIIDEQNISSLVLMLHNRLLFKLEKRTI